MSLLSSPNFLRRVLWADAISCLACGLLQVAFPGSMRELLGLPAGLLVHTAEFLLVYSVVVAWLATRGQPPAFMVWLLVLGNAGWAVACVALLTAGGLAPTVLGKAYIVMQALTVAVLAELQYYALRGRQGKAVDLGSKPASITRVA